MTKDEALKLALEALKYPLNQSHENFNVDMAELLAHKAITAIKEALAQTEQEPVACRYCKNSATLGAVYYDQNCAGCVKRMTTPASKPLSDEEIILIVAECASSHQHTDIHFARAIEAAHGIKGEA